MAEVADKIAARENDAFLARWRAVLQWRSVRRIVVIAWQMCCGQVARLANVRYADAPHTFRRASARYVETSTFEGALNFVLARLVNAWHTT